MSIEQRSGLGASEESRPTWKASTLKEWSKYKCKHAKPLCTDRVPYCTVSHTPCRVCNEVKKRAYPDANICNKCNKVALKNMMQFRIPKQKSRKPRVDLLPTIEEIQRSVAIKKGLIADPEQARKRAHRLWMKKIQTLEDESYREQQDTQDSA